jgi:putative ABC transport system permease protein
VGRAEAAAAQEPIVTTPPRLASWIASASLAEAERDAVLGDLQEEFDAIAAREDVAAARRWYWKQTLVSLVPNVRRRVGRPTAAAHRARGPRVDSIIQDLRSGFRMTRRHPVVTSVAGVSLLVGISLAAVVFSLLNAVLLRPLPVVSPDRLTVMLSVRPDGVNHNFAYPDYVDLRARQRALTDLAAYSREEITLRLDAGSQVVAAELVSGSYFSTLGVRMLYGRPLTEADDRPDAPPAVVVSDAQWQQIARGESFSSRTIVVNSREFSIAGVVAAPFHGMEVGRDVRVWAPLQAQPAIAGASAPDFLLRRTVSWLTVIGRLRPESTLQSAAADLNAVEASLAPTVGRKSPFQLTLVPGRQGDSLLPQLTAAPLTLLLGAALLVLLVACANVANLLLARATGRGREIAVRAALGATRFRLARLVLIETLLIGLGSSLLALIVARWLTDLAIPLMARFGEPIALDSSLDWRVAAFVVGLGLASTVLAAVAPMIGALRASSAAALGDGRSTGDAPGGMRLRRTLVVAQFALSLALVCCATLLARTVYNLRTLSTGFDIDHVALLGVDPSAGQYQQPRLAAYVADAQSRLAQIPGVRAVGFGRVIPLGFGGARTSIIVQGYKPSDGEDMEINFNEITPSYFDAMGIPLRAGRSFDDRDATDRPPVAIVNETMARRYWNGQAVGRHLKFGPGEPDVEIVGIAADVKYRMLREEASASFYLPLAQGRISTGILHVRTHGDPRLLLDALRRSVAGMDSAVPVTTARTLRAQADLNLNDERMAMLIALALGGAAILLAAVGLYGSMSYLLGRRMRELGVRVALGATAGDIRRLVLGQGLMLSVLGTAAGAAFALVMARAIENRLFGVGPADASTLMFSALLLWLVALLASWVPARRAARLDPVEALRLE